MTADLAPMAFAIKGSFRGNLLELQSMLLVMSSRDGHSSARSVSYLLPYITVAVHYSLDDPATIELTYRYDARRLFTMDARAGQSTAKSS
jgi:hypothetical protein